MIFPVRCIAVSTKTVIRDTGPSAPECRTIDVWIEIGRQEPPVRPSAGGESGIFDGERAIYEEAGSTTIRPRPRLTR